jgi:hypothetical protein
MEIGACPACARPYTASEVSGFGILRPRPASRGGPWVEFACPDCGRAIVLVPHGGGRFARPGEPPPPFVPEGDRVPPWVAGATRRPDPPPTRPPRDEAPPPVEIPVEAPAPRAAEAEADAPLGLDVALSLLGVLPGASGEDLARAFRERSLLCHPDKVAHLDPDLQALAHRKFRRLKQAYDMLTS